MPGSFTTARRAAAGALAAALLAAPATAHADVGASALFFIDAFAALGTVPMPPPPPPDTVLYGSSRASRTAGFPAPVFTPSMRSGYGIASYYSTGFAGRPTASGEIFDPSQLTAAHKTLPLGTRVRVTNPATGPSVVVRINDRGPYVGDRAIDLSEQAARDIGIYQPGTGLVRMDILGR